jgi:hypothetical protein
MRFESNGAENPDGLRREFTYDEIAARDKTGLDITKWRLFALPVRLGQICRQIWGCRSGISAIWKHRGISWKTCRIIGKFYDLGVDKSNSI